MKRSIALATALLFTAGAALANHCPKDMKQIDDALAKHPKMSEAQMSQVKKLRAEGEADHKAGNHKASEEKLAKAKDILGLK